MHEFLEALLMHRRSTLVPGIKRTDEIYQLSTIGALTEGVFDGVATYGDIAEHGDFGVGTFNALDGEMVALDGNFYQIKGDGKINQVDPAQPSPFAVVKFFQPDAFFVVDEKISYAQLGELIEKHLDNKNSFCAIRVDAAFDYIKVRAVPRQEKPYKPMAQVAKTQPTFEYKNATGTLIGFRFPKYAGQITVPGFHLHFVNSERSTGGHVLDATLDKPKVQLDTSSEFHLELPDEEAFRDADLDSDKSEDIAKSESESQS